MEKGRGGQGRGRRVREPEKRLHVGLACPGHPAPLRIKRLVRVRHIDHQAERLARFLRRANSLLRRSLVGGGVLRVRLLSVRQLVERQIPAIRCVRRRVPDLSADCREVAGRFHHIDHHRIAGVLHLVKPLDAVVVRIAARVQHVPRRHAIGHHHMGQVESHRFIRQPINVRRRIGQLTPKRADRISAHVVYGDDQHIERLCSIRCCDESPGSNQSKCILHFRIPQCYSQREE